jgi:type I restriction enzyme S subunit
MAEPKLRFKGFEQSWKQDDFSEIGKYRKVSNNLVHHQNLLSLSYGKIIRKDIDSRKGLLPASYDTYQIIDKDTVVFRFTDLQNDKRSLRVGLSKEDGIISPAYVCVDVQNMLPQFFYYQMYSLDLRKVFYRMGDGLRQTLSYNEVKGMPVYSTTEAEQKLIVSSIESIEQRIAIVEKEIMHLKQVKTGALLSMFPQKGESVPRVRFKGFDEPWKSIKADQLFKTYNERNRPDLPVLSAFQDNRGMAVREENGYNIAHDCKNEVTYKHVLPGQFVMHLRSFQGGFAHSSVEGITSPAYTVFGFIEERANYDYFWKLIFMSRTFIKRLESITYGIRDGRSINFDEFLTLSFRVPSKAEQQKIAEFFQNLDRQIEIQTKILDRLKQVKAACLDQMFV